MSTYLSASFGTGFTKTGLHEESSVSDVATLDVKRLRDENLRLREDLAQCQVDKEFVWSLWKKLQVASPDVTEAVALVVEREKQKAEEKDRKVLDILTLKDEKLQRLQTVIEEQAQEIAFINRKKLELHDEVAHQQTEKAKLLADLSDMVQTMDIEKANYQQTNNDLMAAIDELTGTCQGLKDELSKSGLELDRLNKCLLNTEDRSKALADQNRAMQGRLDTVLDKEHKLTSLAKRYESQLRKITTELKSKGKELDVTRKELSDLWETHHQCESNAQQREDIIRQLEDLQKSTEKMLQDCEGAHIKHTDNQYQINVKLQDEISYLRQKELDENERIRSLEKVVSLLEEEKEAQVFNQNQNHPEIDTEDLVEEKWKSRLYNIERENEKLREKLHDKNRVIDRLSKRTDFDYLNSDNEEPQGKAKSKNARVRSKSESGLSVKDQDLIKKYQIVEAKLEQTEIRLQLKESQLDALKQAHQRRLTRLKNLLTSYKLVREQLKVAEDELGRPPKKKRPKFKRPSKQDLQQEDGEAAWNELRFMKTENKNLHIIKMNLEEQLDDMTVRASEDAANVHTLQIQVDTLEQELKFTRKQGRHVSSTPRRQREEDISQLHAKLASYQSVIDSQQTRIDEVNRDSNVLVEEKRTLKFEINSLKKYLFGKKSEIADLHAEINGLQRVVRATKDSNRAPRVTSRMRYVTPVAQRYHHVLRNSVDNMNTVMQESRPRSASPSPRMIQHLVEEERGWVSEPEDDFRSETMSELGSADLPEPANSAVSLGELIARRATKMDVADHSCQTSPRLLQSFRHSIAHRVDQVIQPPPQRKQRKSSVQSRDAGTSTSSIRNRPVRWRRAKPSAFTQVSSLRQRLVSLQMKVKNLTDTRDETKAKAEELVVTCEQLQNEVNASNTRIISQKVTIQKLGADLSNASVKISELEGVVEQSTPRQQADQDRKVLEQKVKAVTQELSKRNSELKQAKSDLEKSKECCTDLSDRMGRLERDVAQKRMLLEDLRLKLRLTKETAKADLQMLESKSEEVARIKSVSEQTKTTMDSMKSSIKALTKEKKEHDSKYQQVQHELAKREKQLSHCQAQSLALQKEMDSLQETARQQLVDLAAQGENAVGVAQAQLMNAHKLIEQFQLMIKQLSDGLLARQELYRQERQRQVKEERQRARRENSKKVESEALNQAKKRAQEILNLSASDIEDLLNSDSDIDDDEESFSSYWKRENSRWVKKWEKALAGDNFVKRVADLFMEKIDEISNLAR